MNFEYLKPFQEIKRLYDYCSEAEEFVLSKPDISARSARNAMEYIVQSIYTNLGGQIDKNTTVFTMLTDPQFIAYINSDELIHKLHFIRKTCNASAHPNDKLTTSDTLSVLRSLHLLVGEYCIRFHYVTSYPPFVFPAAPSPQPAPSPSPHPSPSPDPSSEFNSSVPTNSAASVSKSSPRPIPKNILRLGWIIPVLLIVYFLVTQFVIPKFYPFSDVKNPISWYYFNVNKASRLGLMSGYADNTFAPNKEITREEATVAVTRLIGITDPSEYGAENPFSDVSGWSAPWIAVAASKGFISGRGDGIFDPQGAITREEFVSMLMKAVELGTGQKEISFSDVTSDMWSYQSIMTAASNGIVKGTFSVRFELDSLFSTIQDWIADKSIRNLNQIRIFNPIRTFNPQANVTRAEASAMLIRTNNILKKKSASAQTHTTATSSITTAATTDNAVTDNTVTTDTSERVENILALLSMLNYEGFEVSATYTAEAAEALHRWQRNHRFDESDNLSDELLLALRQSLYTWINSDRFQTLYPAPKRALSTDMTGDDVKYLQTALIIMGYTDGPNHEHEMLHVTGTYDLATQQAVSRWQSAKKLEPTGTADLNLLNTLKSAMEKYLAGFVS